MENQFPIPHSLQEWFWFVLASFVTFGGGAGFWAWLTGRQKAKAETNESAARARNLDIQSTVSAADMALRYIDRLNNAHVTIEALHEEMVEWREKATEADQLRAANNLLEHQLRESQVETAYWRGECQKRR